MTGNEMRPSRILTERFRRLKDRLRFLIGKHLPARRIDALELQDGRQAPICPRCGEFVYYANQCIECGLHFRDNTSTIGELLDGDG